MGSEGDEEDDEYIRRDSELKNSGKGTIGMTPEMFQREHCSGNSEGYSTNEERIDDLRKKGDTETLNKLWAKSLQGIKENPNKTLNFEYKDPWKDGKSAIRHKLDSDNKKARGEN